MVSFNARFGVTIAVGSMRLVMGLLGPRNAKCCVMARRSYVYPSAAITGSVMISVVIGQRKLSGGSPHVVTFIFSIRCFC